MNVTTKHDEEYVAPASPAGYVMIHILQKGAQAGGVVAVSAVAPVMLLYRKQRDPVALFRAMGNTVLWATGATAALGAAKFTQIDKEGFEDRAYRLHYNVGQHRTDLFAGAGGLVGFAAAAALLPRGAGAVAWLGGGAVGMALGVGTHVATYKPAE